MEAQKSTTLQEERRARNNEFIKGMKIACLEDLPLIESSSEIKLKDLDTICKRAIAALVSIQLACDINSDANYEESKGLCSAVLKNFNVEDAILPIEKRLYDKNFTMNDVINVTWSYECYWSLVWALGLIDEDEMKVPDQLCDCPKAIELVFSCKTYEDFKAKTKLRNVEEILDMLDLYYRYHWACEEKRINPKTKIGHLNPDVVWERRRGLEWLISKESDWNEISLDT